MSAAEMPFTITEVDIATASSWCQKEWATVDLGDQRLNRRLVETAVKLMAQPQAPLNQASGDWAATKGSYRLFGNAKASAEKILRPHQAQTRHRMQAYPLVLALQDSSYLDYTQHPQTQELGPIGTPQQDLQGLILHQTLIVTPEGLPLGGIAQEIWRRDPDAPVLSKAERQKRPIEEKESYKWITALRETARYTPADVEVVSVCDREADVYELFVEAERLEMGLLVRATQDRSVLDAETAKVWATLEATEVSGTLQVHVPARKQKGRYEPKRTARVTVRFAHVTLKPPYRPKRTGRARLPQIGLEVVLVREVNPPANVTPLEWLLLTNVPVLSLEDAVERVQWYRCRWQVEIYFRVLKSGCHIEQCRLGNAARLERFIALKSVIAWRLYWMTHINRCAPEAPCVLVLAEHEWHALYATIHRTAQLPAQTPTVRQVVRWVAQLGGFLARKGDGEPGITAIWRGWQRLHDITTTWLILRKGSYG